MKKYIYLSLIATFLGIISCGESTNTPQEETELEKADSLIESGNAKIDSMKKVMGIE